MREALLGVDVGTSGVKAGIVDLDGELVALAQRSYPIVEGDGVGWFEQDAALWWSASRDAIREVVAAASGVRVVGVCIGGQGPSLVAVDERGEPLTNAIIWMDRRTEPERRAMSERAGAEVSAYSNLPKAMWLRVHRADVYARTRWFLQSWDFVSYRLTGVAVASSFANNAVFPRAVIDAGELDPAKFPRELVMGEPVASIRPDVARDLGLGPDVVVTGGVNDSTATVLGAGLVRRGLALDLGGTSGGIALIWDAALRGDGITVWPAPTPGQWVCGGPFAAAGRALPWLMSVAGYGADDYERVERDAASVPAGADGCVFLPYLAGERTPIWDDGARGMFFGLTERHTRAHLARAVLEGVAFSLRHVADELRERGGVASELRITGGQSKVELWSRIKADVLGIPVVIPQVTEAAVLGDAILAAKGTGRAPDVTSAASRLVKERTRFMPDAANAATYAAAYRVYRELYPRLRDLMRGGA